MLTIFANTSIHMLLLVLLIQLIHLVVYLVYVGISKPTTSNSKCTNCSANTAKYDNVYDVVHANDNVNWVALIFTTLFGQCCYFSNDCTITNSVTS
jgi:hypothetical protein